MSAENLTLCDGKYEFYRDDFALMCRRHGEPWREFCGDKATNALFDTAKDAVAALRYYRDECSGGEPSISVFNRMVDEVLEQVGEPA
jgi:hypothetical protein